MASASSCKGPWRGARQLRRLLLTERARDAIVSDARARYPREACGVMGGVAAARDALLVVDALRLGNVASRREAFWFDELEWIERVGELRRAGLLYVGVYHSHPGPSVAPSPSDLERMIECPGEVWLIVAYEPGLPPRLGAWVVPGFGLAAHRLRVEVLPRTSFK